MSQVLLFVHGQISWESAKHVLQALLQRGCQPRIHFLQKNIFIEDSLKDIAQTLQVRREELFNTPWSVMLANDNVYKDPRLGKRLFYHHGSFTESDWTAYKIAGYSDIYCAASTCEAELIRAKLTKPPTFAITGSPRCDELVRYRNLSRQARADYQSTLRSKHKITKEKAVLITSHWSHRGSIPNYGISIIRRIASALPGWQVLLTCHPKLWEELIDRTRYSNGPDIINAIRGLNSSESIRLVSPYSVPDAIMMSDVCVCDGISSIFLECLIAGKLVITRSVPVYSIHEVNALVREAVVQYQNLEELETHLRCKMTSKLFDQCSVSDDLLTMIGGKSQESAKHIARLALELL